MIRPDADLGLTPDELGRVDDLEARLENHVREFLRDLRRAGKPLVQMQVKLPSRYPHCIVEEIVRRCQAAGWHVQYVDGLRPSKTKVRKSHPRDHVGYYQGADSEEKSEQKAEEPLLLLRPKATKPPRVKKAPKPIEPRRKTAWERIRSPR